MKAGVRTTPRGSASDPARAAPSVASMLNSNRDQLPGVEVEVEIEVAFK
jgi:hypothetical protein